MNYDRIMLGFLKEYLHGGGNGELFVCVAQSEVVGN